MYLGRMWVNVLLFIAAVLAAIYYYLTRNYGWFKDRGVHEHEPTLPFGSTEANQLVMGKLHQLRFTNLIYFK